MATPLLSRPCTTMRDVLGHPRLHTGDEFPPRSCRGDHLGEVRGGEVPSADAHDDLWGGTRTDGRVGGERKAQGGTEEGNVRGIRGEEEGATCEARVWHV